MAKSVPEPLSRAQKQKRTDQALQQGQNVAAIDFGTTNVSLAYSLQSDHGSTDDKIRLVPLHSQYERVPMAILLKINPENGTYEVEDLGFNAQETYSKARESKLDRYLYFERIKMLLERNNTLNRDTTVPSFTGGEYYLIEVIAFILKHLKKCLLSHLPQIDGTPQFKSSDFEWVITVPAIWKARAKRMMREAAYIAGLTSDREGITALTPVERERPRPIEENPDKLSLALEPEVAAICAQGYGTRRYDLPERYMVVDIGGGTVDITVHDQINDKVSVVLPPCGNSWGGTTVNEAFKNLLESIVQDKGFRRFLSMKRTHAGILNNLLYKEFDIEKKVFGENYGTDEARLYMTIKLPTQFVDCYGWGMIRSRSAMIGIPVEDDNYVLYPSTDFVAATLFYPTIAGIVECMRSALLNELTGKVNTIYLVGGFGGSQYIYREVEEALREYRGTHYDNMIRPKSPSLTIAIGAVMWRKHPEMIHSRKADATYGISVSIPFNSSKHDEHYKRLNEEQEVRCRDVFDVFLQKGELAKADEIYTASLRPRYQEDTIAHLPIYCTQNTGIQYTTDKRDKLTVQQIGEIVIDIPNPEGVPRIKRLIDVSLDFSGTEIKAKAKYRLTGKEVVAVCDFLSNQMDVVEEQAAP